MDPKRNLLRNAWITLIASLTFAALLALPGRAVATDYNYGTLSGGNSFYGTVTGTGAFLDKILFNVTTPFSVTLSDNFTNFALVSGLTATLYNTPPAGALYASVGSTFANPVSSATLAAGAYQLQISGTALASNAYYSGFMTLNTAPIPEPETYAMMLAGLGLMGFVARRRQSKAAA